MTFGLHYLRPVEPPELADGTVDGGNQNTVIGIEGPGPGSQRPAPYQNFVKLAGGL